MMVLDSAKGSQPTVASMFIAGVATPPSPQVGSHEGGRVYTREAVMKKLALARSRTLVVLLIVALGASLAVIARASTGDGNSDFAHLCQKGGWMTLTEADGTPFGNGGACVSYGAKGGLLGQTISFTSTIPSPVTATYTPTATSTSGLPVAITLDASSTGCALASGVVSFPGSGTCVIDANQAGDGTWAAAAQTQQAFAIVLRFVANGPSVPGLSGLNENPPKTPSGTGSATVMWDTVTSMMTVVVAFSGLTSNNTAAHIHCCVAVPGNAGVATTTPTFTGFPGGVTSGTYSHTFDMLATSSYNASFVTAHGGTAAGARDFLLAGMRAGQTYVNVHTTINPGGEIRGFLGP
jgi:hypothetical protein